MSLQRRWVVRKIDLVREGWLVFVVPAPLHAEGKKLYRVLQPNGGVFDEYWGTNATEVWDIVLGEIDPAPRA